MLILGGPYAHTFVLGYKYFSTLIDDFSCFTWVISMKSKEETRRNLTNFFTFIETQLNKKLKCLRSNNGVEFLMHDLFPGKEIIHQLTCVKTPQQNCIVERKHQHIMNVARVLFYQANLPKPL